jgi:hypothetical protein
MGLMAANFDPAVVRAPAIGVVDDLSRQPRHLALEIAKKLETQRPGITNPRLDVGSPRQGVLFLGSRPVPTAACFAKSLVAAGRNGDSVLELDEAADWMG